MMYTAAVLKENSSHLLRWITKALTNLDVEGFLFQTPQGEPIPHHMTINLNGFDKALNPKNLLGAYAELHVDRLVFDYDLGVCAAPVKKAVAEPVDEGGSWTDINTINDNPHITVCLKPGIKPMLSNQLLEIPSPNREEIILDRTYVLDSWIEEVKPHKTYLSA